MRFKIDKMWPKRNFIQCWAARIVAKMLLNKNSSYQCCGDINWIVDDDRNWIKYGRRMDGEYVADIQVPAIQFAHWVLRESGYSVCQADLQKYLKEVPEDGKDL